MIIFVPQVGDMVYTIHTKTILMWCFHYLSPKMYETQWKQNVARQMWTQSIHLGKRMIPTQLQAVGWQTGREDETGKVVSD